MNAAVRDSRCPGCGAAVVRATAGKLWPFCSERCWALDFGRWLGEDYRISDPTAGPAIAPGADDDLG